MAPQPRMMSDLCSSHQSVMTQTAQQLYNCGFSLSVLTGTKSPHLLSSESDLLTTDDELRRHNRFRQLFSVDVLSALAGSWVGARCAWPGLLLWRKGWAATPSTHSIQPSWLHRTPRDFTRVPVQMRFRLAIARWSRRFHQSPARRGRQQTT